MLSRSIKSIRNFIKLEACSGIILFAMAVLAMIIDNSPLSHYYHLIFQTKLTIGIGPLQVSKQLLVWINEGLMTIFFLLIGLEVKRELVRGELKELSAAILPAIAALGGMIVPALIYIICNWQDPAALYGWAIPVATDIAFSLGILALLGRRVSPSLRMFLLALAIFDDIGAIVIIAVYYSISISYFMLALAGVLASLLALFNYYNVEKKWPYFFVGFLLWICILKSGIHATIAGVIIAFTIPAKNKTNPRYSMLTEIEEKLHPWVSYGILPLFAFANAGVSFYGVSLAYYINRITIGIALGLFLGKQIGIFISTWLTVRLKIAILPKRVSFVDIYGIGLLAGIGFTMSLFIGGLAFAQLDVSYANEIRIGVIIGSLLSGITGYLLFRFKHYHYSRGEKKYGRSKFKKHSL